MIIRVILGVAKMVSKIGHMKCPNCEQTTHQHKIGKTPAGSQRYRCYFCKHSYTPEKKEHGYGHSFRQKAIRLYVDGLGLRRKGRQLFACHHRSRPKQCQEKHAPDYDPGWKPVFRSTLRKT